MFILTSKYVVYLTFDNFGWAIPLFCTFAKIQVDDIGVVVVGVVVLLLLLSLLLPLLLVRLEDLNSDSSLM